jgi:hypothetical protein
MVTFREIDQQLYDHERPAYRYWATGGGSDPTKNPVWVAERKRLTAEWHRLCPWKVVEEQPKKSWWTRFWKEIF